MNREMKHSGIAWIGDVPKQWRIVRTKNVFNVGKELVGEDSSHTQLLSLTTKGIKKVEIGSTSGKVPDSYDTYQIVHKDNLVFCLFDLDCSAVFSGVSPFEGMISPAYKVLSMQNGYYPQYYGYWFDYIFDGRKYKYLSKNIRYSLTYDEFASLGIVAPSYAEQKAIADFLDKKCEEIDELVALQEKIIEELKSYKQSVITETVCKGLNPNAPMKDSGVEWIGEIPEGWEVSRFKNIASVKANLVSPEQYPDLPQVAPDNIEKDAGILLNYKKVKDANIISDNHLFYKGQIVYSKIRPTLNKAIIAPFDGLCSADMYPIETTQHTKYMLYFILSGIFTKQVQRIVNDRVKMPKINKEEISTILAIIPPIPEQREIADYLDKKCSEIDQLISIKQQKIVELKEYKKSLIYEYTTGKKEV